MDIHHVTASCTWALSGYTPAGHIMAEECDSWGDTRGDNWGDNQEKE